MGSMLSVMVMCFGGLSQATLGLSVSSVHMPKAAGSMTGAVVVVAGGVVIADWRSVVVVDWVEMVVVG